MFEEVIKEYQSLEPVNVDRWNILHNQNEYWHRYRLMAELRKVIKSINIPEREIKVLDVGCGVGKSSRMLLEFGLLPENITALDIRKEAISFAKKSNSSINFLYVEDFTDWPGIQRFDLVMQCTAFSSIPSIEARLILAKQMQNYLADSYLFWWDLIKANPFAGSDFLSSDQYFEDKKTKVFERKVSLRPTVFEALRYFDKIDLGKYHFQLTTLSGLLSPLTHKSILYKF